MTSFRRLSRSLVWSCFGCLAVFSSSAIRDFAASISSFSFSALALFYARKPSYRAFQSKNASLLASTLATRSSGTGISLSWAHLTKSAGNMGSYNCFQASALSASSRVLRYSRTNGDTHGTTPFRLFLLTTSGALPKDSAMASSRVQCVIFDQ